MPIEVVMPRLGWTMETGRLVEWLKHDGDMVQSGELMFAVESDKAVSEVEALDSGILRIGPDSPAPDVDVLVGAVVAYLLAPGEVAPWEAGPVSAPVTIGMDVQPGVSPEGGSNGQADPAPQTVHGADSPPSKTSSRASAISPRARRVAAELSVDWATIQGSGRDGRIVERDVRAAPPPVVANMRVTPTARRMAQEAAIDLAGIAATLDHKRVTKADVQAAIAANVERPKQPAATGTPISSMRRIIAGRMVESAHTVAPVTLTTEADATELVQLRVKLNAEYQDETSPAPSYSDFLVRLVALALLDHPRLNATWAEDTILEHAEVHVGVAVDTERGLLVPVIRNAHQKSVGQIGAESAALIEQARHGRSAANDLRGGTFTITNLGMYDIDAFTPLINLPECAILGIGRIVPRLCVIDETSERTAVRKMMALSLTFDHRIVDGAPAARFLRQVKLWVEHPYRWVLR